MPYLTQETTTMANPRPPVRARTLGIAALRVTAMLFAVTVARDVQSAAPATMDDFWSGRAFFEYDARFTTSSAGSVPAMLTANYNVNNSVVVKDGVWYHFNRELIIFSGDTYPTCGVRGKKEVSRIVARRSTDQGLTWTDRTVVVEPTVGPTGCTAGDGDAYFDRDTGTWHLLYQCISTGNSPWNICHSTLRAGTPMARFVDDPQNPVVRNRSLWSRIYPARRIGDEGTPEIVRKADGYFFVTFHGYDIDTSPIRLYRGIARTRDFVHWETINNNPIYSPGDCSRWYTKWKNGVCYGGGAGTILTEGSGGCEGESNYMLVESSDVDGGCREGQTWAWGLLRSPSLTTPAGQWETRSSMGLLFSTHEPKRVGDENSTPECSPVYAKLFRDGTATEHLMVHRPQLSRLGGDSDRGGGHFHYTLRRGAPMAHYAFREGGWGSGRSFTQSDAVSRGNLEAIVAGVTTSTDSGDGTYSLKFKATTPSLLASVEAATAFDRRGDFTLTVRARLDALPPPAAPGKGSSAFIAGKRNAYWLELYPNGNLCAWIIGQATGAARGACKSVSTLLGQWHTYTAKLHSGTLMLQIDGTTKAQVAANDVPQSNGNLFVMGALAPDPSGYWGPFSGLVDDVKLYNY